MFSVFWVAGSRGLLKSWNILEWVQHAFCVLSSVLQVTSVAFKTSCGFPPGPWASSLCGQWTEVPTVGAHLLHAPASSHTQSTLGARFASGGVCSSPHAPLGRAQFDLPASCLGSGLGATVPAGGEFYTPGLVYTRPRWTLAVRG